MKFLVENTGNKFEHARRKAQYLELIRDAGATITGTTSEGFSVEFPHTASRIVVQQFIEGVAAIGSPDGERPGDVLVTAEPGDALVLAGGDAVTAPILQKALERGDVTAKDVLPDEFFTTIDSAAYGPSLDSMSEAQQDEAYQNMRDLHGDLETENFAAERAKHIARQRSDIERMRDEAEAELKRMRDSGQAAGWHRDTGF